jgi:hypothetical protein
LLGAQVVPHVIELPSPHSQLGENVLGNVGAGPEVTAFCITLLIPAIQLVPVISALHVELFLAYSAPARVAPASAADLAVKIP